MDTFLYIFSRIRTYCDIPKWESLTLRGNVFQKWSIAETRDDRGSRYGSRVNSRH